MQKKKEKPSSLFISWLNTFYIILENLNVGKIFPWHLSMGKKGYFIVIIILVLSFELSSFLF